MIVAAGLSPAWQQVLVLDRLRLGEVNRAREVHWCSSGKVLNVGLALHHLGGPQCTVSVLGGSSGEQISSELEVLGVHVRWIEIAGRTRVCTTLLDRESGQTTELVENAQALARPELERFHGAFREKASAAGTIVLSGSLPRGAPRSFYRELLAGLDGRAVLDVRGEELLEALHERPFVVKPNREELAATLGRVLEDDAGLLAAMRELNERGARWVVVTGGTRAVLVTGEGQALRLTPLRVETVNAIGCGDCLAAGIAWAIDRGIDVPEAVAFGIACAAQNAAALLPSRLDRARAEEDARRVAIETI